MKLGILSMQRVINYGSYLQAYALHNILTKLGHECRFIDIRPGEMLEINKSTAIIHRKIWKFPIKKVQKLLFAHKRESKFKNLFWPVLGIDRPAREDDVDCIVVGSDEVFNCLQPDCPWGVSLQLYGDTIVPTFSYAASFGHTSYEQIKQCGVEDSVRRALSKMTYISVRDNASSRSIEQLLGTKPEKHIDPVLLYDWDEKYELKHEYENYIFIYAYDNRICDLQEIKAIKAFAKKYKKKIISFGMFQRWADKNVLCSPFELIQYFREADYVITDTFHGSVLSIKTNRPFATIIRETNRNKITDLLSTFSLTDRIVNNIDDLESILAQDIKFSCVNQIIHEKKEEAFVYLSNAIKEVKV